MSPLILTIVSQTELQVSSTDQKVNDISAAVVKQLQTSCVECAPEMIDNQFFVCYQESPSHVTYRARLEGTSERGSDYLISLIEDWVRGGPGVIVTGVLMTVDSHCSVVISSFNEGECPPLVIEPPPPPEPSPSTDPTASVIDGIDTQDTGATPDTTGIVAGAVVAVIVIVLIIAITIAIVVIVFLVLKSRRGELSLKKSDRKYVAILYLYHNIFLLLCLLRISLFCLTQI